MDFLPLFLVYISFSLVSFLCFLYVDNIAAVLPSPVLTAIDIVRSIVGRLWGYTPSSVRKHTAYLCDYIFQTKNLIFVLLYISLVLSIHLICGLGCLPYIYAVYPHTNHMFYPLLFLFIHTAAFLLCWLSDPGYIDEKNVSRLQEIYEYDGTVYQPAVSCATCKLAKPARSKHCAAMDRCIFRFDHYCAWVGNAVAVYTQRWFLLYTGSLAVVLTNAIRQLVISLGCITRVSKLWSLRYLDTDGNAWPMDWSTLIQTLFMRHPYIVFLTFAITFTLPIIVVLCAYHIYLIATNQTTNERYKKHYLRRKNRQLKTIPNPYNKGIIQNFAEVFYPEKYLFGNEVKKQTGDRNGHGYKKKHKRK